MEGTRTRLWPLLIVVSLGLLLGAGCGGSDSDDAGLSAEEAKESLSIEPVRYMRRILAARDTAETAEDCAEVAALNRRSPYKIFCTASSSVKSPGKVRMTSAATYGPAAVIDYDARQSGQTASIILIRDPSNEWALNGFGLLAESSVGSDDEDGRPEAREALDRYLTAVRERDCAALDKYAVTSTANRAEVCKVDLPATLPFARCLQANPDATPRYVGGNSSYRFYSLAGDRPTPASE